MNLQWVEDFVCRSFDVKLSHSVICTRLQDLCLSNQLTGSRKHRKGTDEVTYAATYYDFLLQLEKDMFFDYDQGRIFCIDFCTDSRRMER